MYAHARNAQFCDSSRYFSGCDYIICLPIINTVCDFYSYDGKDISSRYTCNVYMLIWIKNSENDTCDNYMSELCDYITTSRLTFNVFVLILKHTGESYICGNNKCIQCDYFSTFIVLCDVNKLIFVLILKHTGESYICENNKWDLCDYFTTYISLCDLNILLWNNMGVDSIHENYICKNYISKNYKYELYNYISSSGYICDVFVLIWKHTGKNYNICENFKCDLRDVIILMWEGADFTKENYSCENYLCENYNCVKYSCNLCGYAPTSIYLCNFSILMLKYTGLIYRCDFWDSNAPLIFTLIFIVSYFHIYQEYFVFFIND